MTANRETSPAPGERAHPALALANSRRNAPGGVVDALDSATSLQAWLRGRGFESERTCEPGDVTAFVELRQAVRELVLARVEARAPDGSAVSLVNRVAAGAPTAPRLEWGADGPRLTQNRLGGRGLALVSAVIAVDAMALVAHAEDGELRACAAPGCVRLLLRDHPRRQWCSTRCGDRVRAGRYYHRHRAPSEDES
jgi:predicted RNA-binding Zn ribbon-like protein